jgi:hypothetical protein
MRYCTISPPTAYVKMLHPNEIPWGLRCKLEKSYPHKLFLWHKFCGGNGNVYLKSTLGQSAFSIDRFSYKQWNIMTHLPSLGHDLSIYDLGICL